MKKLFLAATIALSLFSCSDDDSENNESPENTFAESIIGTWELQSYTSNGEEYVEVYMEETDTYICKDIEIYDGTNRQYNELWGDNCENVSEGEPDEAYTITGDILAVFVPDEDPDDDTDDSYTETYTITQLDDTTLVLTASYIDEDDGEDYIDISTYEKVTE